MDYTDLNIIKIIPGIYIADIHTQYLEDNLSLLNLNYIININKTFTGNKLTIFDVGVDANLEYIDSTQTFDIDFNTTNLFIITALQNNSNILICDTNYSIPILIIGAFLIKYLKLSFTECIYWLTNKCNFYSISKNICYQLFIYYKEIN